MRPTRRLAVTTLLVALSTPAHAQNSTTPTVPTPLSTPGAASGSTSTGTATATPAAPAALGAPAAPPTSASPPTLVDPTRGAPLRAYHDAMARRRLGGQEAVGDRLAERVADAEQLVFTGRNDEAIAKLEEIAEDPTFAQSAETPEGRAALYWLGHALAQAGINESARAYLRRSIGAKGAWEKEGLYARRSVQRLVEIALDTGAYEPGLADLQGVPASAPAEVRAEISYLRGRAKEAAEPDAALAAFAEIPQTSRFWSQATYLSGLIQVERGRYREAEALFCKVADPKRQDRTVPVFADERFFAVRDLARLALGRVAHEQLRHDHARYYYYLVPRDSNRLAEALYESATTRYEKKDYEGARELLDELKGLKIHHRYEDEARVLDAYIDLALCRFPSADAKLQAFLRDYEPTRDAARRLSQSEGGTRAMLAAARAGVDAAGTDAAGASVTTEQLRAVAALVRVDPVYGEIAKRRAVLDHEAGGLRLTMGTLVDMQRSLATTGGVRPAVEDEGNPLEKAGDARAALDGVRRQVDDLEQAHAPADRIAPLRKELADLEARFGPATTGAAEPWPAGAGTDLPDLLRADAATGRELGRQIEATRTQLAATEAALAQDALHRLDLRLSRLLRRARLGRIESVLGKKRALEVEIEAINAGYLPNDALDSLDAARYMRDSEEYWPFEGDDWPDEFVGSEGLK